MAVTAGHGNPKWSREETLLALELYFSSADRLPGPGDARVIRLSEELRALQIHPFGKRRPTFRNPDGVAFKLQNLHAVSTGKGLANVSAMDRAVWAEFHDQATKVAILASAIRSNRIL
jgi:5-methylcytosine-specific restriction enzyme A